ncbi:MAG: VOC family protein [Burkholderiales bacterium]
MRGFGVGASSPASKGSVMTVGLALDYQEFVALNSGPHFTFTPAISFAAYCDNQVEIERV